MSVRHWLKLTKADFERMDCGETPVLLPFGATEQHGPHLPVGTDLLLAKEGLRRVEERLKDRTPDLLMLPPLWCTKSNEHAGFPGSLYLDASVMQDMLRQMAEGIVNTGFRKLILANWHGGNSDLLSVVARDIRQQTDLLVFIIDVPRLNIHNEAQNEAQLDMHAGSRETSMMLAAYRDLVKDVQSYRRSDGLQKELKENVSFEPYRYLTPQSGGARVAWLSRDLGVDGVIGDPSASGSSEGERYLEEQARVFVEVLEEIVRFEYPVFN